MATSAIATAPASVIGTLNFAADPEDGGRFCNTDASRSLQKLVSRDVPITDARTLAPPPSIEREGFVLAEHIVDNPQWFDEAWVDSVYAPSCEALVKRLTGADRVVSFFRPLKRIADPAAQGGHMSTAGFVHLDHPRDHGRHIARMMTSAAGTYFKRATLYNVWKAITPAPQDRPLTVADRRTVPADAHVIGTTVADEGETPYVIMAPDEAMRFYYFSDMAIDESIVFTGVDFDAENPLGCAHSAFSHPDRGVSRSSIEARIIAIFE